MKDWSNLYRCKEFYMILPQIRSNSYETVHVNRRLDMHPLGLSIRRRDAYDWCNCEYAPSSGFTRDRAR